MYEARDILIYFAIICRGNVSEIVSKIENKEYPNEKDLVEKISNLKCKCITMVDKEYPESLRGISYPPIVLFYQGDISLLYDMKSNIGVIGSRKNTCYGADVTQNMVKKLSRRFNIVSGMATGIDAIAHTTALINKRKTIAVLGFGFNYCYPLENKELYERIKKEGLVISEYPPDEPPNKLYFPMRNRIIAAISRGIVVTEAAVSSGTAITVNFAIDYDKEVFCVPHRVGTLGAGCNALIRDGAYLVENADDIFYYYDLVK